MRRAGWAEGHEVGTCPETTGLSSEMAQGAPCASPAICKEEPSRGPPHLAPNCLPGWPCRVYYWGSFEALHCVARHRHRCLEKWKSRTKGQPQKSVGVETIRTSPGRTPKKDHMKQRNRLTSS